VQFVHVVEAAYRGRQDEIDEVLTPIMPGLEKARDRLCGSGT